MLKKLFVISLVLLGLVSVSFGQKGVTPAKKKIINQLVLNTADLFPIEAFEESFEKTNELKSEEMKNDIIAGVTEQVNASNLSDQRKSEMKPQIDEFAEKLKVKMQTAMNKGFNVRDWTKKSLEKRYLQNFTLVELQKLNKFFSTEKGKRFVKFFNEKVSAGIREDLPKEATTEDEEAIVGFALNVNEKTADKFTDILIMNVMDDITNSIDVWGKNLKKELESSKLKGELKKEFEEFVANAVKN
jgi:hypothetical protein